MGMNVRYAMKAAPYAIDQLLDRAAKFESLGLKPAIELHLFGSRDIFGKNRKVVEKNCHQIHDCDYIVHFPLFDFDTGYIYDAAALELSALEPVLDFCNTIGSRYLVMHRCFGFGKPVGKPQAEEGFLRRVAEWNKEGSKRDIKILIENYGFVWLPECLGKEFLSSAIDHFFPWDLERFRKEIGRLNLSHIDILLDIAHASLSSNMFNMLKNHTSLRGDARFVNIYAEDLNRRSVLEVKDFILDSTRFFHVSDTFRWEPDDGLSDMKRYLYTENLPIGSGNIDFSGLFNHLQGGDIWLTMEIDPGDGDYSNNQAQLDAVIYFMKLFEGRKKCASL